MKVTQIYELMNSSLGEVLGRTDIVKEDLSNVVDIGKEVIDGDHVDAYVKKLVNHIGKVIFNARVYKVTTPSVLMDAWEFGSILEKVQADIPLSSENSSWELEDGKTYNQDVFHQPKVSAKFFNNKVTLEVKMSFTELQVKQSFSNAEQLNGFLSMLYNAVEKSMTIQLDNLIMKTLNNMTAETIADDLKDDEGEIDLSKTGVKAINLLALYNEKVTAEGGKALTPKEAYQDRGFIQYASYRISLQKNRMARISDLFNIAGKSRFTSEEDLSIVLLNDFASAAEVFLQSDTFHNEMTALPNHEVVPYWQGSGTGYAFEDTSKISVKTASGDEVTATGIIGVMFDREAIGVANLDKRVTTHYNASAEFFNNFYKMDAGFYVDHNENYVVFFVA